jgi:predicted RNase H-like HicB family nuclease
MVAEGAKVKTYVFRVVVEPDEERWHAFCPILEEYGAATWGYTEAEALKNITEVVEMVLEELVAEQAPIPEGPVEEVFISAEPRVAVTL